MPRSLTAADRTALIKLATSLPKGDEDRRAILAGLAKTAKRDWDNTGKGKPDKSHSFSLRLYTPNGSKLLERKDKMSLSQIESFMDRGMKDMDKHLDSDDAKSVAWRKKNPFFAKEDQSVIVVSEDDNIGWSYLGDKSWEPA